MILLLATLFGCSDPPPSVPAAAPVEVEAPAPMDGDAGRGLVGTERGKEGDDPEARLAAQGVEVGRPVVVGALGRAELDAVIRKDLGRIRDCGLVAKGKKGEVQVRVALGPDGVTERVELGRADDAALGECVLGVFREMRFPAPRGGGNVVVAYPITFR